jgi:hypothetical protein
MVILQGTHPSSCLLVSQRLSQKGKNNCQNEPRPKGNINAKMTKTRFPFRYFALEKAKQNEL